MAAKRELVYGKVKTYEENLTPFKTADCFEKSITKSNRVPLFHGIGEKDKPSHKTLIWMPKQPSKRKMFMEH